MVATVALGSAPAASNDICSRNWSQELRETGSWEIEYDLTGSEFETRDTPLGAGDATHPIRSGSMTIRFDADVIGPTGSTLDGGRAQIVQFSLTHEFAVQSRILWLRADVRTNVHSKIRDTRWDGNPEGRVEPAAGAGSIHGAALTVHDPGVTGYRSFGSVLCEGVGCALGRLPRGVAQPIDNAVDLTNFDTLFFGPGGPALGAGFVSNEIALPAAEHAIPVLRLRGAETRRTYVPTSQQSAASGDPCYSALDR